MKNVLWVTGPNDALRRSVPTTYQGLSLYFCDKVTGAADMFNKVMPVVVLIDADRQENAALELCFNLVDQGEQGNNNIIILSSSKDPQLEIDAFRAGAVDFVSKPINADALLSRIIVRSGNKKHANPTLSAEPASTLKIDKESYTVYLNQQLVLLSKKEFELLDLLASQPGKVFTREEIFDRVWNKNTEQKDRTIDVHILRLRKKIGENRIATQKGIGYRFMH